MDERGIARERANSATKASVAVLNGTVPELLVVLSVSEVPECGWLSIESEACDVSDSRCCSLGLVEAKNENQEAPAKPADSLR